jgi:CHRD domain
MFMRKLSLALILSTVVLLSSCRKETYIRSLPQVSVEWKHTLRALNENPSPVGRTETAELTLQLLSDNSLRYGFQVNNLKSGDVITAAHIHAGDPVTNGPVLVDMKPSISNNIVNGTVTGLRQSFIDSLLNKTGQLYFNVHSSQVPSGLLRAQLNEKIIFAADVALTGAQEVPPVTTTATGQAWFRVVENNVLYSKVSVANLEATDALTAAHIHTGATGVNGPVLIPLAASAADFGVTKTTSLSASQYDALVNNRLYVNVHTTLFPAGKIRGQLR